ncbi:MAG: glycosyltransferase family 2 protein [Lentisphaerae bacterium]|nr:glycosyltransferase family 2 protein [Lentisphaerota bacterium]
MLTVSLVTYHHRLPEVAPVIEAVLAGEPERFFIVDNGSDRQFAETLAAAYPGRIDYIPSANRGFGAGHNQAMRRALELGSDFHAIVNPDISFIPGTLAAITEFMSAHREIGLVMPKTLYPDGTMQYNCKLVPSPWDLICRRFLPKKLTFRRMHRFTMQHFNHDEVLEVPYLCGCFMVFSKEALIKAGLFDERFFMYPEDIDITRRIYSAGFRTVYYPKAAVIHAHEQASKKSLRMLKIHIVNMIKYFNKWGWFFDAERRKINREVELKNRGKQAVSAGIPDM